LSANTKYLIIARAHIGVQSITNKGYFRVQTADDTTIATKSEVIIEFANTGATNLFTYFFVHSFTTDATPDDIDFQFKVDGSSTATMDQYTLLVIDLDDLGAANYEETITAATGADLSTTAWGTEMASIAAADLGTTDEWLVLGYARIGIVEVGNSYFVRLHGADDASTASDLNSVAEEAEDAAEVRIVGVQGRHKAVTSNVALAIDAYAETPNPHTHQGAYLIAINASAFDDFSHDYASANNPFTAEETVATVASYAPTTSGNHLIIGHIDMDDASGGETIVHLEDGTTETRTGDSGNEIDQVWTATDIHSVTTLERISISTTKTYNLRAASGGSGDAKNSWLLVLNLNLVAGGAALRSGWGMIPLG
jgi:hypothetical protein